MSGIVVGIDGSHHSSHALDWAMAEAALRKAQLTVIAVNPVPAGYWARNTPVIISGDSALVDEIRTSVEESVAEASAKLDGDAPAVTIQAFSGFAAKALIEASKDADLVVVGMRGGGGFASLALGSVSSQVVHHAQCPVVVVRSEG
jgi:nucleotide-binding universal stress UspA family protein